MGNKQPRRQRATAQGYGGPVRLQFLPDIRGLTGVGVCRTHVTLELAHKVLKRAFKELLENLVVTSSQRLFSRWLRELECKAVMVIVRQRSGKPLDSRFQVKRRYFFLSD